jgi:hypothetical protein
MTEERLRWVTDESRKDFGVSFVVVVDAFYVAEQSYNLIFFCVSSCLF